MNLPGEKSSYERIIHKEVFTLPQVFFFVKNKFKIYKDFFHLIFFFFSLPFHSLGTSKINWRNRHRGNWFVEKEVGRQKLHNIAKEGVAWKRQLAHHSVVKVLFELSGCTSSMVLLVVAYAKLSKYNSRIWRDNEVHLYVPNQYILYLLQIWFHKQSAHGWRWDHIWNTRQTLSWLQASAKQCLTLQCLPPFDLPDGRYFWEEYFKLVDVPLFFYFYFFFLSFPESPKAPGQGLHGGETFVWLAQLLIYWGWAALQFPVKNKTVLFIFILIAVEFNCLKLGPAFVLSCS